MGKDKSDPFNNEALKTAVAAGQLSDEQKMKAGLGTDTPEGRKALETAAKIGRIKPGN